jgi:hypothetical protein
MSVESTTVFVKLDYWDVYWANVALMFRMFRISLFIDALVATVFLAVFVLARVVDLPQGPYQIAKDSMILILVWGLLASFLVAPLLTARRALKDEQVQRGKTYEFSETGVHVETPVATSDIQWAAFRYVIATRSLLLLLAGKTASGALILPLRSFANEADLSTVRQLLDRKVPKTKLRLY